MDDNERHNIPGQTDEQIADETSPLGSMSEEVVLDTEEQAKAMGIHAGINNPLHSGEDLTKNSQED